jgi:hypothetical protein
VLTRLVGVGQTPSGKKLDLNVLSSNYHLEMNPGYCTRLSRARAPTQRPTLTVGETGGSDVGVHDRVVVPGIIKEIAQTQQLDPNAPRAFKGTTALPAPSPLSVAALTGGMWRAQWWSSTRAGACRATPRRACVARWKSTRRPCASSSAAAPPAT